MKPGPRTQDLEHGEAEDGDSSPLIASRTLLLTQPNNALIVADISQQTQANILQTMTITPTFILDQSDVSMVNNEYLASFDSSGWGLGRSSRLSLDREFPSPKDWARLQATLSPIESRSQKPKRSEPEASGISPGCQKSVNLSKRRKAEDQNMVNFPRMSPKTPIPARNGESPKLAPIGGGAMQDSGNDSSLGFELSPGWSQLERAYPLIEPKIKSPIPFGSILEFSL